MKILNKEEFKKMPNGTMFSVLGESGIRIKTGAYEDLSGWNGELYLEDLCDNDCNIHLNTCDNCDIDYEDGAMFKVFEYADGMFIADVIRMFVNKEREEVKWYAF